MIEHSETLKDAISKAISKASAERSEFLCPEHLLWGLLSQRPFADALAIDASADLERIFYGLNEFFKNLESVPEDIEYKIELSSQFSEALETASKQAAQADIQTIGVPHIIESILHLKDSFAHSIIEDNIICSNADFISLLVERYELVDGDYDDEDPLGSSHEAWKNFVVCLNEHVSSKNPLIGREKELRRTIQILCRKEKNNPLYIGEPGVGKTALVWGLAALLETEDIPHRLKGFKIFELDLGNIVAGSQFRGDLEKRLKIIMDGILKSNKAIIYIDDIHNLIGAGQNGDGAMDATQILRPYMEIDTLRFIGSTNYQDFNRHLNKQRGFIRRFQPIDINEPSKEDTIQILKGLQPKYELFHHVRYDANVIEYAVDASIKHISDRFLPDKAIDLIDEAGAMAELQMKKKKTVIRKKDIDTVLTNICKINAEALKEESNDSLKTLSKRMKDLIYGQDEAIEYVVNSVEMAKAGLLDTEKPLASLLFVGPTGVGKTEVAKVLSEQLGIELIRFDMSEYTEKHTVAKLIGSPAGYVGYEDGGLLTDAIRKNPNCVLLLDEIEKAHSDIYNILLQVMDYGRLTDNRGNKADFRNVVLIMTSNAGAQYAAQANIGFSGNTSSGEAMLQQVKRTFKPEFINRLSGTVVFRDMDKEMAQLILNKKLKELQNRLEARNVTLHIQPEAHELLMQKGFTRKYGAREIDRTIQQMLSPLLMREILYGNLKKGGTANVEAANGQLTVIASKS